MSADTERLHVTIDPNALTNRDWIAMEDAFGIRQARLRWNDLTTRELIALIWTFRRKDDPTFTVEQAYDLPLDSYDLTVGGAEAPPAPASKGADPKGPPAAGDAGPKPRGRGTR